MKIYFKKGLVLFLFLLCSTISFAQTNITIDLDDDVYELLRNAESQNLCGTLSYVKPYSKSYIVKTLQEIKNNLNEKEDKKQLRIVDEYLSKYDIPEGLDIRNATFKYENQKYQFSFVVNDAILGDFATGIYRNSEQNSTAYDFYNNLNFQGDVGKNISYQTTALLGLTKSPVEYLGEYEIGEWLYHNLENQPSRKIKTYRNNSFLPYKTLKFWDGSCYYLSNLSANGLEGWPVVSSIGFSMNGDVHSVFFDNKVELSFGRKQREWAAMDDNSSLVLNSNARPFIAFELDLRPFKWLQFSTLTGILENPNQAYINSDAWYGYHEDADNNITRDNNSTDDSYYFQNAFSLTMLGLNFKYFHFDFGSTAVWPKRFELGYVFPLLDRVVYQNNIGDFDNLALFMNMKGIYPGLGSIWFSLYLDEVNVVIKSKFWEKTRVMFAYQAGVKVAVPVLPFTTVSFRYTKVEPYCYTHHSINYTPWYSHYISENYSNNGQPLGYYLQPNSDEFNLEIKTKAIDYASLGLQYQLIRHGVDWGSGAVPGSNLYSELRNYDRDDLYKYFLRDGTYEWSNIVSISGSYDLHHKNIPVKLWASFGFIYDWFTEINGEPGKDTEFQYSTSDEYKDKFGCVLNIGFTVFKR